jgi:glycosyltransferase involved in cell wall biosynthesis
MRIAIDATALYGRYGGVEYALWNLLYALAARGDETTEYSVYIPHDGPPPASLAELPSRWRWIRLPFCGHEKLRRIVWQQLILPRRLREDGCDVLHAPTYVAPLWHAALRPHVPLALTVYDLIALDQPQFATAPNRLHYRALLPPSIRRADRVIVPSDMVCEAMLRRFPQAAHKIRVVPPGLEPIFFRAPSTQQMEEVRGRYDLPEKFLLFVGNFEPKKNLFNVLRALEILPDAPPLVVAGGARARHRLPSTPRVRVLGYVPRADLPALYALCRAFVFPSLAEGFGLPVLEALACGAPVVTSRAVPLPELADVALLCEPSTPASIAGQLDRIFNDEQLRAQLAQSGREYARPYTWQRAAEKTMEIYRALEPEC